MTNANAEVYYESTTNSFSYKGSLTSGNSMDVSVSNYGPVWVLVIPTSSFAYISVTSTPTFTYNNSSYSSSSSSSDDSTLVAILVPTLAIGFIIIIVIVIIIVKIIIWRIKLSKSDNNEIDDDAIFTPELAPQLYYPPNHNLNNASARQVPNMMQPIPHPMPLIQPSYSIQQKTRLFQGKVPTKMIFKTRL